ncbi:mismatch-specific DNA-glycosylase [Demequina sp. NBRC 110056]|uniref:mismatch-specific DNA-glycosylase n=1 Tax=Demequina sp. NBRC 110056 TaxID=1570345 RepID=UPI00210123BA|nr:mismatch-specific DNA-glycosylase [Demequina sp. NBRC 110056]
MLPDYLAPGLRVVFCGTAPGLKSAAAGHYYAGPGNQFWTFLHEAGFVPEPLSPGDDVRVLNHGLGLTDLVETMAQSHDRGLPYDGAALETKVRAHRPSWVAFTSKEAGKAAARHSGQRSPGLGHQAWPFGGARVFVLPSPSGRNQGRRDYDGCATRLEWWAELARLVRDGSGDQGSTPQ